MSSNDHSPTDSHLEEWAALLGTEVEYAESEDPELDRFDGERT
ncbi:hypothetical protein [Haloarcula halophila]|nr:hypothetical protein [Halomicroarcula sp. DFY41]